MEQRQDQQAVVGAGELEVSDHHGGHGLRIVVAEHDALGFAGRATGVDEQRQVAAEHRGRWQFDRGRGVVDVADMNDREPAVGGIAIEVDDDAGAGVFESDSQLPWR